MVTHMKKTILALLIAVMTATPCLAQEIEPEGMFSTEGTLWEECGITYSCCLPSIGWGCYKSGWGFYQGTAYRWGQSPRDGEFFSPQPNCIYIDSPIISIVYYSTFIENDENTSTFMSRMAIIQPSGVGVFTNFGFTILKNEIFNFLPIVRRAIWIGIIHKIEDDWTPPEVE